MARNDRHPELSNPALVIRADASRAMGIGHAMRCLALSQAWRDRGGKATFATGMSAATVHARLQAEGIGAVHLATEAGSLNDAKQTIDLAQKLGASWVVLDGYHFGAGYQRAVKDAGIKVLAIDDYGHSQHYFADVVLNQNLYAREDLYDKKTEPDTCLLLGTRYVLLRREFLAWQSWDRDISNLGRRLLVTMGGSDPHEVTLKVLQALKQSDVDGLQANVVMGTGNCHHENLASMLRDLSFPVRLESVVTDMAKLMAEADLAVSAAGSTAWEMAFMGLPSVLLVAASNQLAVAEALDSAGAAKNLGWHSNTSPHDITREISGLLTTKELRARMARRGRELVDGEGTARVLMRLMGEKIRLRKVKESDGKMLWDWVNDPDVRAASFASEPIPWENHLRWLGGKLRDPSCFFFIALDDQDIPVGQIRFDLGSCSEAQVSVSIDKTSRGLRYGSMIIRVGLEELCRTTAVTTFHAYIKPNNPASIRAFENAQFKPVGAEIIKGYQAVHYARAELGLG